MTREQFKEYAAVAIAKQRAFAQEHGTYLRPAHETATRAQFRDELMSRKRRLEKMIHRRVGARSLADPDFYTTLSVPAGGTTVHWRWWPATGRREILEVTKGTVS